MRWCPECGSARPTTITYSRKRNADGHREAVSAECDLGHQFDPYD